MHHPNYLDHRSRLNQYTIKDNWGELVNRQVLLVIVLRTEFFVYNRLTYLSSIFIKLTYINSMNSRILITNH